MVPYEEVELLREAPGLVAEGPVSNGFALNMYQRGGRWCVRSGFGQVTQFDTTLARPVDDGSPDAWADAEWGYRRVIGSALLETNFGHTQHLTLLEARVYTGETADSPEDTTPTEGRLYVLSVYDLDTDARWEEPLHLHTSDLVDSESTPMWKHHATHETAERGGGGIGGIHDYEQWVEAVDHPAGDEPFFTAIRGSMIFGVPAIGAWLYRPAVFGKPRNRQIDNANRNAYSRPYGESSLAKRMAFRGNSAFEDGFAYLDNANLQQVDFAYHAEALGRTIYVVGRSLLFSDVGFPAAVMQANELAFFTNERITCVREFNGALYVFTDTRTMYVDVPDDTVITSARIVVLSDTVGCTNPNCADVDRQVLTWCDRNGLYSTMGNLQIKKISDPGVDEFFRYRIDHPLTAYYAAAGHNDLTAPEQPQHQYSFDPKGAHLVVYPELDLLLLVQPGQRMALVRSEGWSVWSWESLVSVSGGTPRVGIEARITEPRLAATDDRLVLVGGLDTQDLSQDTQIDRDWSDLKLHSAYLLEYGRGGALDRSIDAEDDRGGMGWVHYLADHNDSTRFYIHAPIRVPDNWTYQMSPDQQSNPASPDDTRYEDWFFPVTIVPEFGQEQSLPFTSFELIVRFANDHWQPVLRTLLAGNYSTVDSELCLEFPPERLHSIDGYAMGVGSTPDAANFREAQVYDGVVPDKDGMELRIQFNGSAPGIPGGTWDAQPGLGLIPYQHNTLFYIPMRRLRSAVTTQDVTALVDWDLNFSFPQIWNGARVPVGLAGVMIRRDTRFYLEDVPHRVPFDSDVGNGRRRKNNVAQPVDWAFRSPPIDPKGAQKLKLRGVRTTVRSRGAGVDLDSGTQGWAAWPARLINFVFGSDRKDVMAQIIDYDGSDYVDPSLPDAVRQIPSREGVRTRLWNSATASYEPNAYGGTTEPVWGDPADPAMVAHELVGSDEVSEHIVSTSVKGSTVRVTLFGHMMNRAATLTFESAKALLRLIGNTTRRGRNR